MTQDWCWCGGQSWISVVISVVGVRMWIWWDGVGTGVGVEDRDGCVVISVVGIRMWIGLDGVGLVLVWGTEIGVC